MADRLPRDLQLQILKRLPLNSILISRTVCKSWNTLITSNDFISAHLKFTKPINQNGTHSLFIRNFDRTRKTEQYIKGRDDETFGLHFVDVNFQYASKSAYFRVVGYCDGVVCFSDDLFESMHMVIVWNPSVRKTVRVLVPDYEQTPTGTQVRRRTGTGTVLGFGICPRTCDPNVVRIVYVNDLLKRNLVTFDDPPSVEVFSIASSAWRKPFGGNRNSNSSNGNGNRPRKTIQFTWSQVCFNGVIHWVACDEGINAVDASLRCCLIVSFDLVDEVFGEMPLPDALAREHISNLSISNREGRLSMLEYDMGKGRESCGVWVMKEYGVAGSWEKMYVIRLPGMLRRVVGFRMNGDGVLALKNNELVFVERSGNVKSLGIYGNIRSFFVGSYVESLILINQLDQ